MRRVALAFPALALLATIALGQTGDLPLDVKGESVKIITSVGSTPFTLSAPAGADLYFWQYPPGIEATDKGDTLEVKTAPNGEVTFSVKTITVDWAGKKLNTKFGSRTVTLGGVNPGPGPGPGPGPNPPPATDLSAAVKAAYSADPDPNKSKYVTPLSRSFTQLAGQVNSFNTWSTLWSAWSKIKLDNGLPAGSLSTESWTIWNDMAVRWPDSKDANSTAPLTPVVATQLAPYFLGVSAILDSIVPPGPPGPPVPPPGSTASYIVGITDNSQRSQQQAAILLDQSLLKWLADNKVGWRVFDISQLGEPTVKDYQLDKIMAEHNVKAPCIIGWFNGVRKAGDVPQSVDAVKKFVQGFSLKRVYADAAKGGLKYFQGKRDKRYLTRLPPRKGAQYAPRFEDKFGVIPRDQWKDVDRRAVHSPAWILDQDGHGSCVGHGSVMGLRIARFNSGMTDYKLSATCCYAQINGGSDNGAIIGDSLIALQKTGTILFDKFGPNQIYLRQLPSGWQTEAARFKIDQGYTTPTFDEVVSAIQLGYVVVFGMEVGNNFESFDQYGVAGFASGYGNHCLCIDGCKKLPDGRWAVDVINSWGVDWGPWGNGRCYMVDRHINSADNSDAYAIKTATEDPQETNRPPRYATPGARPKMSTPFSRN